MKKYLLPLLLICLIICNSCKDDTYSKQIRAEAKKIENYINREGIKILSVEPELKHGDKWGEKEYIALEGYDHLYFHLSTPIDTSKAKISIGDHVNIRYRKYGLDADSDTISWWTTDDAGEPIDLALGDYSDTKSCVGWHLAILHIGYSGAECKLICPSTAGFTDDNTSVTPYCYDLKITKKK